MAVESRNSALLVVMFIAALVALGGGYVLMGQPQSLDLLSPAPAEQTAPDEPAQAAAAEKVVPAPNDTPAAPAQPVVLNDTILGDPAAPVRITEFASLTCGHCAAFHTKTLPALKQNYLDTGRAYLVFIDFPLNAPALQGSMLAHCLPKEKYFDFIGVLFENQEQWAFDAGYLSHLQKHAADQGMSEEDFKACLKNQDLQQALLERMKAAQAQWSVSSTPTFVINNNQTINGSLPYEAFDAMLKSLPQAAEESVIAPAAPDMPAQPEAPAVSLPDSPDLQDEGEGLPE